MPELTPAKRGWTPAGHLWPIIGAACLGAVVAASEAQARFLMGAGCEQAQGYYFSRPVPADRAAELLRAGRIEPQSGPLRRLTSAA